MTSTRSVRWTRWERPVSPRLQRRATIDPLSILCPSRGGSTSPEKHLDTPLSVSEIWIILLLVWRRSEHGMISPQRRLPSRFRGRTWRDGGSWQRQHHGDQLGKHHGDWWSCDAGPSFWPDLQSRKTCSHQTEGNPRR